MTRPTRSLVLGLLLFSLGIGCGDDAQPVTPDGGPGGEDDGGASSGTGGDGTGGGGATTASCGGKRCDAFARCDSSGSAPECICAEGYSDTNGDGTECEDIDECSDSALNDCAANAACSNRSGSYLCECDGPAYAGDGKTCSCADGYVSLAGECVGEDGSTCSDEIGCESGHCIAGVCCASACDEPDSCQEPEGPTCADGSACVYAGKPDGTVCDDGDLCTSGDLCNAGACAGTGDTDCDDLDVCTEDSCEPTLGCIHDGRQIPTTTACGDGDDVCGTEYHCSGDIFALCIPTNVLIDCSGPDTVCERHVCDPTDGSCDPVAMNDGGDCDDGNACTIGETCNATGSCVGGTTRVCDDGNTCTDDSCDSSAGCLTANNTSSCDDGNPCSSASACSGGLCTGTAALNCADTNVCTVDACDSGVASGDPCTHLADVGADCDDGLDCTSTEQCTGAATCADSDPDSACGVGSLTCSEAGTPLTCTCDTPEFFFDDTLDICVADVCSVTNNPCDSHATCTPVFNGTWQADCDCNTGYTGDGLTCTDINECAPDPCGVGAGRASVCTQGAPGTYTCGCNPGFTPAGGTCSCDLDGLYAIRIDTQVSWPPVYETPGNTSSPVLILAGSTTTYSWALRDQSYDANGNLQTVTIPCGGTTPDLCGTGANGQVVAEAYAQFLTNQIWGSSAGAGNMPTEDLTFSLPNAYAGQPFVTPETVALAGMRLNDEAGAWPAADDNVRPGGTATQTNGATWENNDDGDGKLGVTTYAVPPGGIGIDGTIPDPPFAYGATSGACASGQNSYNLWPVGGIFSIFMCDEGTANALCRVTEFHIATRIISALNGSFTSCDLITGDVTGPDPDSSTDTGTLGEMRTNARIGGCRRRTGGPGSLTTTPCAEVMWDFVDDQPQTQKLDDASFIIRRVPDALKTGGSDGGSTVTCAEVRGMTF